MVWEQGPGAGGRVVGLGIARRAGAPVEAVPAVRAVAGRGLEGDRYFLGTGTWQGWPDPQLTLIEEETVAAVAAALGRPLEPLALRRNVVTRGVRLEALIGQAFRLGDVWVEGIRPCDPCGYLEGLVAPGLKAALAGRGGLRARILTSGIIRVGDPVVVGDPAGPANPPPTRGGSARAAVPWQSVESAEA